MLTPRRETPIDALELIDDWPARAAVAVVGAGGVVASRGPIDEEFALASVTKILSAMMTMFVVQERLLLLDEPIASNGATVRHLLSHAGGLSKERGGRVRDPEERRIYSNWGFEILGSRVEDETNEPFADSLAHEILAPLGVTSTRLEGSPAHAAVGTVSDLAEIARELLEPRLLATETITDMTTVQFGDLDGVLPGYGRQTPNPWGLGLEIRGTKAPHWTGANNSPQTFGHFGQAGGFLWVDPEVRIACVNLSDTAFGAWAIEAWPPLADAILDQHG
ncbi:MAG: serine hydrolase domain-containing protein [Nitriliruptorales bacterium]|nr:serine hydrolase domain-containing protein [Nitriliruptorales bacterium]